MIDIKNFLHAIFAGALGALAAYFNVLLIPLIVLIAVMLIDYITGMAGAARACADRYSDSDKLLLRHDSHYLANHQ